MMFAKRFILAIFLFFILISVFNPLIASAQREDQRVCSYQQGYAGSPIPGYDIACSFAVNAGDHVIIEATKVNAYPSKIKNHIIVSTSSGYGNTLSDPVASFARWDYRVSDDKQEVISFRVTPQVHGAEHLTIKAWVRKANEKPNLVVIKPYVDEETGELVFGYKVEGVVPISSSKAREARAEVYYGKANTFREILVQKINLTFCAGKAPCSRVYRVSPDKRPRMEFGQTHLYGAVDTTKAIGETNGNDNDSSVYLDDFFMEDVPQIMRRVPASQQGPWELPAQLLSHWLEGERFENIVPGEKLTWETPVPGKGIQDVPVIYSRGAVDWLVDPANSADGRGIKAFNKLTEVPYFTAENSLRELSKLLSVKFARTSSKRLQISKRAFAGEDSWRKYHSQHIQFVTVQSGGSSAQTPLDSVTAALGGHSLYLVPFGTAEVFRKKKKIAVNIDSVAVHLTDMFDFRGFQPLGCWKEPNLVSKLALPGDGYDCLYNSSYRWYRTVKNRGGDFVLLGQPKFINISPPISFEIDFMR